MSTNGQSKSGEGKNYPIFLTGKDCTVLLSVDDDGKVVYRDKVIVEADPELAATFKAFFESTGT